MSLERLKLETSSSNLVFVVECGS